MAFEVPDYTKEAEQTGGKSCPFCPENILKMTPLFPNEITKEGRVFQGQSTVFPNLFPYSKHNRVVVMSEDHYLRLDQLTVPIIKNTFLACQAYMKSVIATENKPLYASINWNYPPILAEVLFIHICILFYLKHQQIISPFLKKKKSFLKKNIKRII